MKLSKNAKLILSERYLRKNPNGEVAETPEQRFKAIAATIGNYDDECSEYYKAMANLDFLPNSPTIANAGKGNGLGYSACFVINPEDSLDSILDTFKLACLIHKAGGGTGFSFSDLRPANSFVGSTGGVASGPVSFMKIYDAGTQEIKQGGMRRGANMGILRCTHPDIEEFINCKDKENTKITNFNISVAATKEFLEAAKNNKKYWLINPHTRQQVKEISARNIFNQIIKHAHETADPGIFFIDEANLRNPNHYAESVEATNPCGEVPLSHAQSCILGSINLSNFVEDGLIDWERLESITKLATRFLNNVIMKNIYPAAIIEKRTKDANRIGLGVMGFADMLIRLSIKYDSEEAAQIGYLIMEFINYHSISCSSDIANRYGSFPTFQRNSFDFESKHPTGEPHPIDKLVKFKHKYGRPQISWTRLQKKVDTMGLRNAYCTSIAPTGTIGMIADCSTGIEPIQFKVGIKRVLEGKRLKIVHPLFGKVDESLLVPFSKVSIEQHVLIQSVFQRWTCAAVSKTINLPKGASVSDIEKAYSLASELGAKGITVYRDGCKSEQVYYEFDPEIDGPLEKALDDEKPQLETCQSGVCEL